MAKAKKNVVETEQSGGEVVLKSYELALLVKPLLPFDVQQKVISPLTEFVKKSGGAMTPVKDDAGKDIELAKKHLAYPIKKHEEGYYGFYSLQLPANKAKELERQLKFNTDVLRFLLISEDKL
ncbi:MAG: 30S ribosomal protein S6 [Candidatus Doudnabacteria bacterium]|nr:30S ribosomal protein S6 [Candidatus Doudnabacteria bacterium]